MIRIYLWLNVLQSLDRTRFMLTVREVTETRNPYAQGAAQWETHVEFKFPYMHNLNKPRSLLCMKFVYSLAFGVLDDLFRAHALFSWANNDSLQPMRLWP